MIKRFLPRSLLGRSLLIIVTPLILLQVVTAFIFFDRHWETISKRLSNALAGDIAIIVDTMLHTPDKSAHQWIFDKARGALGLDVFFEDNATLLAPVPGKPEGLLEEMLTRSLNERVKRPFRIDSRSHEDKVEILVQTPSGVLRVVANRKRLFSTTTYIFILWMVGTSLVLFAVATIFMRNQVRPVRRLAAAADNFGKGRDVPDFKPEGATEVRRAAAAFKQMQARIQRQIRQRTEMLAGVSHDLGTVLTRMKLELAMLDDSADTESLSADVSEMQRMIEGYLAFARGENAESPVPTNLDDLLEEVAGSCRRNGEDVSLEANTGLMLPLRPNDFRRCLGNLVGNAVRYAKRVEIRAARVEGAVEITVDDDGPGIPENLRAEAFRPFFRIDSSRNLDTGGVGLGLSISRDIIHSHGGEITLDDSPLGGLRVRLHIPV